MNAIVSIKDKSGDTPFLKAAAFRKNTRRTEPHKHNSYFEIIYLSGGRGYHYIDNKGYAVRPPVLFFVRKEQVHHWDLEGDPEPEGYVVILKKTFINQSLDGELKSLLARVSKLSCLYFGGDGTGAGATASAGAGSATGSGAGATAGSGSATASGAGATAGADQRTIQGLLELLSGENGGDDQPVFALNEGLVKALFAKILQLVQPGMDRPRTATGLYEAYTELLSQGESKKQAVAHYADLLNTTPQNLNAVCRKAVNQSAADVLAEYMINEAKRLLVYTDKTVSEISYSLAFSDPSHFVKYFKRYTDFTPQIFRSMQR